jgi:hypothetical protein
LDELAAAFEALGMTPENPAVAQLMKMHEMFSKNKELFLGVEALSKGLVTLSKLGALDADTFAAINTTAMDMFRRIQDVVHRSGGTHKDALRAMVPYLAQARRAAKEYGYELDAGTQELIDQAEEYGLLQPEARTMTEILESGFDRIGNSVDRLVSLLEDAFERMGWLNDEANNFPGFPDLPGPPDPDPNPDDGRPRTQGSGMNSGGVRTLAERTARPAYTAAPAAADIVPNWGTHKTVLVADGRVLAEVLLPYTADAAKQFGVGSRKK